MAETDDQAIIITGVSGIFLLNVFILVLGVLRGKRRSTGEEQMLGKRDVGVIVGATTMTATWLGGDYLAGTCEQMWAKGFVNCQAAFCYTMSLIVGGFLFAGKMRSSGYSTILDPFQERFGPRMCALLFIPCLAGEILWTTGVLNAFGNTLHGTLDISADISVSVVGVFAICYSIIGGLYSLVVSDTAQLWFVLCGLWFCVPFAINHKAVGNVYDSENHWIGTIVHVPSYIDNALMLLFGGIPWQAYFQHVLASKSVARSEMLSYMSAFGCMMTVAPACLIGAIARNTRFAETSFRRTIQAEESGFVLGFAFRHLLPPYVTLIGIAAVGSAVLTTTDASIISAATVFVRNVYQPLIKPNALQTELLRVKQVVICVVGMASIYCATRVQSVYLPWYMSSDLAYIILFPQLLAVLYFGTWCNTYGAVTAFFLTMIIRLTSGEQSFLKIRPIIEYPSYALDDQLYPYKTLFMLISTFTIAVISKTAKTLFEYEILPEEMDVFRCFEFEDRLGLKPTILSRQIVDKEPGVPLSPDIEPLSDMTEYEVHEFAKPTAEEFERTSITLTEGIDESAPKQND